MEYNARNAMEWSRLSSRKAFGKVMCEFAKEYKDFVIMTADVAHSAGLCEFKEQFPDRFYDIGIAEMNMVAVATGLAKSGTKVFVTTFAPFASMRCFEALRTQVGYMNADVCMVSLASGLSLGTGGNTHFGLEDVSLVRTIPNMTVLSPADCTETVKALESAMTHKGPMYIRLTGVGGNPIVYKDDYDFEIGKSIKLREGDDIAILASGMMVNESIRASKVLQKDGISAAVYDIHTIKPLDTYTLDEVFKNYKMVVTVEEHTVIGGLGGAVAEYKAGIENAPKQLMIGLPDEFGPCGEYKYLTEYHGIQAKQIAEKIKEKM